MNNEVKQTVLAVRLSPLAHEQLNFMCQQILLKDKDAKINLSKMVSYIISQYHDRFFEKELKNIISVHRDKRKEAKEVLGQITEEQLESVMKVFEKFKNTTAPSAGPIINPKDEVRAS